MNRSDALLKCETGDGVERPLLTFPRLTEEKEQVTPILSQNLSPKEGFCIKTKDEDGQKIFINICTSDELPAPPDIGEAELTELLRSSDPSSFKIPMSLGYPRMETDNGGQKCSAIDVVINDTFYNKIKSSHLFNTFLISVVLEGLDEKHKIKLNKDSWINLKNKKYFGTISGVTIRKKLITELNSDRTTVTKPVKQSDTKLGPTTPNFILTQRPPEGKPTSVCAEIELPGTACVLDVKLQIGEDRIILETKGQKNYKMDIFIPINVDPESATAIFIKKKQTLYLSLPCADVA